MKIQNHIVFIILGVTMICCLGCEAGDDQKDVITQIDDEFSINMLETLDSVRQLTLELKSIDLEPCLNSTIDRAIVTQPDKVTILLNGIIPASDCNPGMAPAFSTGNAGLLAPGTYDFEVTIRNTVENTGKLIVKSDQYEINMLTTYGIIIENELMHRIPENTIWGYYAYNDQNLVGNIPSTFINQLEHVTSSINLKEGYYGYFNVNDDNEIELINPPQQLHIGYFSYRFNGTENDLTAILESHRAGPSAGNIELAIFTSNGKIL